MELRDPARYDAKGMTVRRIACRRRYGVQTFVGSKDLEFIYLSKSYAEFSILNQVKNKGLLNFLHPAEHAEALNDYLDFDKDENRMYSKKR